jgi:hypothetical protein
VLIFYYRYNTKCLPISEEELKYSLGKVGGVYRKLGPYDFKTLLNEGLLNKKIRRVMHKNCIMKDGSMYTGQFRWGLQAKDGIGYVIYPDGSLFEGIFKNDDTLKGRYIFTNGYVYEGDMMNHKMHGKGVLKYQGKVIYEGEFINGEQADDSQTFYTTASNISPSISPLSSSTKKSTIQFNL